MIPGSAATAVRMLFALARGCGSAAAAASLRPSAPRRCLHFTRPVPSLSLESIESAHRGGSVSFGPGLNEHERVVVNAAKRGGFLALGPHCGAPAANAYFRYCWSVRRPYVAIHRDGGEVVVDAGPVAGLAAKKADGDIERALVAFRPLLAALGPAAAQVVNADTLKAQAEKAAVGGALAGGNEGKARDTLATLADTFSVHVRQRAVALRLAKDMHAAFVAAFGLPSPSDLAAAAADRKRARVEQADRLLLRKLRRLVQQPIAVKNLRVPRGVLDGFLAAERAGTTESVLRLR